MISDAQTDRHTSIDSAATNANMRSEGRIYLLSIQAHQSNFANIFCILHCGFHILHFIEFNLMFLFVYPSTIKNGRVD